MNPNEGHDGVWWLYLFLGRTFFLACDRHPGNNQNRYCIDCDTAACPHCIAEENHASHRVLNIYRLVYKDVVSLDQMSTHIDCSRIQPYASNGRQVLALHPLPHYNSGQIDPDRACRTCTRVLMNPNSYSYCSIACKLFIEPAAANKGNAGSKYGAGDRGGGGKRSKRSNSRVRKRKGVPHRSPLF